MKIVPIRWFVPMCLLTIAGFGLISAGSVRSHLFRTLTAQAAAASTASSETKKANLEAYTTLLRENVPDEKEQLIALVMFFDEADAAKFWPIYEQYRAELDKLNASEAASINDYVRNNGHLTEQQADQIVHNQTHFQSQRAALLDKYYDKFKAALGPASAARFIEAENQLLSLTDLQLSSALPVE
jgi:hypothetical protein